MICSKSLILAFKVLVVVIFNKSTYTCGNSLYVHLGTLLVYLTNPCPNYNEIAARQQNEADIHPFVYMYICMYMRKCYPAGVVMQVFVVDLYAARLRGKAEPVMT